MKFAKTMLVAIIFALFQMGLRAQSDESPKEKAWYEKGSVYGKIFTEMHSSISDDNKEKGFEVRRAYFGYKSEINEYFSGDLKLDIGNPNDVTDYAAKKRFAYFKNAYVQYKYNNLKVQFGISDCFQFKEQEKFWGYRYILPSFQDKYKFGPSADIGAFASYKFNNIISGDVSFVNGEGYSSPQSDENFKATMGATIRPAKPLILRVYFDSFILQENTQYSIAAFVGLTMSNISLGSEFNYQANNKFKDAHDMNGLSFYSTYKMHEKFKLFGRYDYLESNILEGDEIPWNLAKDGSSIVAGIEYTPYKGINMSLNYQDWIAYATNGTDEHYIYFNIQLSF